MATTNTSRHPRTGTRRMRAAYVDRFDPSAARWIQRERHPHPQRWCALLTGSVAPRAGRQTPVARS